MYTGRRPIDLPYTEQVLPLCSPTLEGIGGSHFDGYQDSEPFNSLVSADSSRKLREIMSLATANMFARARMYKYNVKWV